MSHSHRCTKQNAWQASRQKFERQRTLGEKIFKSTAGRVSLALLGLAAAAVFYLLSHEGIGAKAAFRGSAQGIKSEQSAYRMLPDEKLVREGIEKFYLVERNRENPAKAYHELRDALNAARFQKEDGMIVEIPDALKNTPLLEQRPDVKFYLPAINEDQGNVVTIRFDSRLIALAQFLDIIASGGESKMEAVMGLLKRTLNPEEQTRQLYPAEPPLYQSYELESVLTRNEACTGFGVVAASIFYSTGSGVSPLFVFGYGLGNSDLGPVTVGIGHFALMVNFGDGQPTFFDPTFLQMMPLEGAFNASYPPFQHIKHGIDSLFANGICDRGAYCIMRLPEEGELQPDLARKLERNEDVAAGNEIMEYVRTKVTAAQELMVRDSSGNLSVNVTLEYAKTGFAFIPFSKNVK